MASKAKPILYDIKTIAEMLGVKKHIVRYAIKSAKIDQAGVKRRAGGHHKTRVFDIAAVNKIRDRLLRGDRRCTRTDADRGQHGPEATEFLTACDKYKRHNRIRRMKISDYLAVFKSLGYRKMNPREL